MKSFKASQALQTLIVGAIAATVTLPVSASTDTTTFQVTITITSSCDIHTVAATDVAFGSQASTGTNLSAVGSLTANCTPGTTYAIGLDNGLNVLTTQRRMLNGTSNYVAYNLWQNSTHTTAWGTAAGSTYAGTGTGATQAIPVYGTVPSANSPAGSYTDTVTATITY